MKLTVITTLVGALMGTAFFFTISQAHAGICISDWNVSLVLESIEVDGEPVENNLIEDMLWPTNALTNVYAGDSPRNEFNSRGETGEKMCFEYERD